MFTPSMHIRLIILKTRKQEMQQLTYARYCHPRRRNKRSGIFHVRDLELFFRRRHPSPTMTMRRKFKVLRRRETPPGRHHGQTVRRTALERKEERKMKEKKKKKKTPARIRRWPKTRVKSLVPAGIRLPIEREGTLCLEGDL